MRPNKKAVLHKQWCLKGSIRNETYPGYFWPTAKVQNVERKSDLKRFQLHSAFVVSLNLCFPYFYFYILIFWIFSPLFCIFLRFSLLLLLQRRTHPHQFCTPDVRITVDVVARQILFLIISTGLKCLNWQSSTRSTFNLWSRIITFNKKESKKTTLKQF